MTKFNLKLGQTALYSARKRMTEALGTPDKRISDWAYNAFAQRTRIKVNNPSQSTIIDYQYTYDAELNITQKTN